MNGCKACKHNIKDADISNLGACGQCIIDASNFFCEFPQEKARPVLFDYPNKESSMVLDNNDDSLFHEFFFEEPIPETTLVMTGIGNNHYNYNCTSKQLHTSQYIYILQPQDFVPCEHPPSTEMDPLLGHSQAPPSIFAQEGTEESAPQASGIATRKMISSSSYENFFRSPDFFL
ncbi:7575_t:CDS:2 [Entrophospora sp. SA101]|nr:7575_t:CDS:2 [Entrophospora sp. SA101]